MLIGDVNFLLDFPGSALAVGTPIIPARDDLIIYSAEYTLTFFAFLRVVDGNAVAHWTGDQLSLQETVAYPLLIDEDQLRFAGLCLGDF